MPGTLVSLCLERSLELPVALLAIHKAGGAASAYDAALLTLPEEQALIREIARLPPAISDAIAHNEPSIVARLLLDVASAFSRWYTLGNQDRAKRILVEGNEALKASRLALTQAVRNTLSAGLTLLGVPTPEQM